MSFADKLRAAMTRAGVNQSELARRLGIKSQAVNQWLAPAGTAPRGARLIDVATALGVGISELLGEGDGAPTGPPVEDQAEADLLAAYRSMTEEQRSALLMMAKVMVPDTKPEEPQPTPGPKRRAALLIPVSCRRERR